jgi:hypothetical protein
MIKELFDGQLLFTAIFVTIKLQCQSKCIKNMSLYEVNSLSNVPSLSTAVLNALISLSNLTGLIAIPSPCTKTLQIEI